MKKVCNKCNESLSKKLYSINNFYDDNLSKTCKKCSSKITFDKQIEQSLIKYKSKPVFIYIITNTHISNEWVKIGRSTNLSQRLKSYNTGCPFRGYKIVFSMQVREPIEYEKYFSDNVKSNGYEWFKINEGVAEGIILGINESQLVKYG